MSGLSKEQMDYIATKALVDVIKATIRETLQNRGLKHWTDCGVTEAELELYCKEEAKLEAELDLWQAIGEKRRAERALMDWAYYQVKRLPQYTGNEGIERVLQNEKVFPTVREKAINLCMRLRT